MILAIVGTREPALSYKRWCETFELLKIKPTQIVSGGARGIDRYAKRYAEEHSIELIEFLPDYPKYGKVAPLIRNKQIVDVADMVVAFPSSTSKGTLHTIKYANQRNKKLIIVEI